MDTCVQLLRDYTVQWCADISRPASLSLFVPPSSPISRYIFLRWKERHRGTGMEIGQDRPTERYEIIQTKANEPCSFCLFTLATYCCCTHTLSSTHFPTTKIHLVRVDRLETVILTARNGETRAGRERGTILSRSIGYRYLDVQFQRLNTPFPQFQLGAH